jgi:hypothetical protein
MIKMTERDKCRQREKKLKRKRLQEQKRMTFLRLGFLLVILIISLIIFYYTLFCSTDNFVYDKQSKTFFAKNKKVFGSGSIWDDIDI